MGVMFEWEDKFSVGNEKIDKQHQYLFRLGNEIIKSDESECKHYIMELFKYTKAHFVDAIPIFKVPDTILWKNGFTYINTGAVGWILLIFKVAVIFPLMASFAVAFKLKKNRNKSVHLMLRTGDFGVMCKKGEKHV